MTTASDRAVNAALVDVWRAQLVAARRLQGISQRALAEQMGVRQAQLGAWELGDITPDLANWQLWAGALGFELQMAQTQT